MSTEQLVIPIHTSDRAAFKRCRRRWSFTSPMKRNLVPMVRYFGIAYPLWFGTGVHWALEQWYAGAEDYTGPGEVGELPPAIWFKKWFEAEMAKPDIMAWKESGLDPEDEEELQTHYQLGIDMLNYYERFAVNDDWEVIATEHNFSIPLGFSRTDSRTGQVLPVHYKGRQDMIIRDSDGLYWIVDHKTTSWIGDDYFAKLNMDEQCTSYLWAATHEFPDIKFSGVIYNVMRKAAPSRPPRLKNGNLSLDKQSPTTALLFLEAVVDYNLEDSDWFKSDKVQAHVAWLASQGDQFVMRHKVRRNATELHNIGNQIVDEAKEMTLNGLAMYPNPTGERFCLRCVFRSPCLAMNDGSDAEYMLRENYEPNTDRGLTEVKSA